MFHDLLLFFLAQADAIERITGQNIVVDTHGGERVGLLEDHPCHAAYFHRVHFQHISPFQEDLPGSPDIRIEVMHPVDGAQQGALTASRRPHDGGDRVRINIGSHFMHGILAGSVGNRDLIQLKNGLHVSVHFYTFHLRATILAIQFSRNMTISNKSDDDQIRSTRFGSL